MSAPSEARPRGPGVRPRAWLVLLLGGLLLLSGCRLEVTGELTVDRDGSGTAVLDLHLDADAVARLDELRVDPTAALLARTPAPGWEVTQETTGTGGLRVRLVRAAPDPTALTAAFRDLVAGLGDDDPALSLDLDLTVADDGASRLEGTAVLRPPATAGASRDGVPLGPAGEELAALVRDHVDARLTVTLPGTPTVHDADEATGRTLTWVVPVGTARTVTADAAAPAWFTGRWPLLAAGGLLLVALAAVGWAVWRRRRRRA